jgi:succinoglycan biosynthesis transport protein ExoP
MRREIAVLKKQLGESAQTPEDYTAQIDVQKAQLAELRQKYSDDHPDVVKARHVLENLQAAQKQAGAQGAKGAAAADTAEPTSSETRFVLTMRNQLDSVNREVEGLKQARAEVQSRIHALEARVGQGPQVEKDYLDLQRDHDTLQVRYRELKSKQMSAEVAEVLEKDRKGERFSLIDPPQLPERPVSPNRPMILLVGALISAAGGIGWGALLEAFDRSVKGVRELQRLASVPLLGAVPYVENEADLRRRRRTLATLTTTAVLVLSLALAFVHFFIEPLPVLWYTLLARAGLG